MDEPDKKDQGKEASENQTEDKARFDSSINFLLDHRIAFFSGVLVFVGLVLAFFIYT